MKKIFFIGYAICLMLGTSACKSNKQVENHILVKVEASDFSRQYQVDANLTDKRWKLTEIKGEPITETEGTRPAYITFNSKDGRVSGNSGCNSFSGTYLLKQGNKLVFFEMVSTRMMCTNMDIENKLNEVFRTIESYNTINGNTLILNGTGTTPLARFTAE